MHNIAHGPTWPTWKLYLKKSKICKPLINPRVETCNYPFTKLKNKILGETIQNWSARTLSLSLSNCLYIYMIWVERIRAKENASKYAVKPQTICFFCSTHSQLEVSNSTSLREFDCFVLLTFFTLFVQVLICSWNFKLVNSHGSWSWIIIIS